MVIAALARRGMAGRQTAPDEVSAGETTLWLGNLRAQVATKPLAHWPRDVDRFVAAMTGSGEADEVPEEVLPRLLNPSMFPPERLEAVRDAALTLSPELLVLPAFDLPDSVHTRTEVAGLGGWEVVWPTAIANLRRLPAPEHRPVGDGAARVMLFESEDMFGASRVLIVEDLLRAALGEAGQAPHGVLFAAPARDLLAVHILGDGPAGPATVTLNSVSSFERQGALTRFLHYRSPDGQYQQVSSMGPEGRVRVEVSGAFEAALGASQA